MLRIVIITVLILQLISKSYAQLGVGTAKDLLKFKERTTLVILTGKQGYDDILKQTIEQYWKFNPYKFITRSQISKYNTEKDQYLYLVECKYTYYSPALVANYPDEVPNHFMLLENLKGPDKFGKYTPVVSVVYSDYTLTSKSEEPRIRAELMRNIQSMQYAMDIALKTNSNKDKALCSEYDGNTRELKNKTLLISKDILKNSLEGKIVSNYPLSFKVVDQSEIDQTIIDQAEDKAYVQMIDEYAGLIYRMVFATKDGKILYAKMATGTNQSELGESTLDDIMKTINK